MRERILDAALEVLGESGIRRLTQPEVSKRAGVRQSHLTYYFPTRHDLLEAVTERGVDRLACHAVRAFRAETEGGDGALIEPLARSVAELAHMRMLISLIVEADGDPTVRRVMQAATRRMEAVVAEALDGDDARECARRVLAALWGVGLYHFLMRPEPLEDLIHPYVSWLVGPSESASDRRE